MSCILATLLSARLAADHADQRRRLWAFYRSLVCHHHKRITVTNHHLRRIFSWSGGSRLDELQPQKEEPKASSDNHTNQEAHCDPWFGARGSNTWPGMAMPGSAPPCHSCYCNKPRKNGRIYTALTTKLFKVSIKIGVLFIIIMFMFICLYSWIGWLLHFGLTPALLLSLSGFKTKTSFRGFLSPHYTRHVFYSS